MDSLVKYHHNIQRLKFRRYPVVIDIVGEIDSDLAMSFCEDITTAQDTGQSFVPVMIHSVGGDVYSLISMINAIEKSKIPVVTIVSGFAASAAAVLFTCGTPGHRFIGDYARLMIHSVSSNMFGSMNADGIVAEATETKRLNEMLSSIMSRHCGKSENFFSKFLHKRKNTDVYIDSKEAVKLGMADMIEIPKMVTHIMSISTLETLDGSIINTTDSELFHAYQKRNEKLNQSNGGSLQVIDEDEESHSSDSEKESHSDSSDSSSDSDTEKAMTKEEEDLLRSMLSKQKKKTKRSKFSKNGKKKKNILSKKLSRLSERKKEPLRPFKINRKKRSK